MESQVQLSRGWRAWFVSPRGRIFGQVLIFAVLGALGLLAISVFLAPRTSVSFYVDRKGNFVADVRKPTGFLRSHFVRLTGGRLFPKTYVWNGEMWVEKELLNQAVWRVDYGYRVVAKVPESKWKVVMNQALKREIRIGGFSWPIPSWTNVVLEQEFPGRVEIGSRYNVTTESGRP